MRKRSLLLVLLAIFMVFILVACGNGNGDDNGNGNDIGAEEPANGEVDEEELPIMTMEEVAENDGRDGANAYVVVEGIVYDVTGSPEWPDGNHRGNQAGQDLTEELLEDSPHGASVLDDFEAVGRIEE